MVTARTKKTKRPELTLAFGPLRLASPGEGTVRDLYGSRWSVGLYRGGPHLFQARSGVWLARADADALAGLEGAEHISLAFDQAARPVLAWARPDGVYVRQWSGSAYTTRGPLAGCDPVLIADAPVSGNVTDSDVILWHLSADRSALMYRLQRDVYSVAHVARAVAQGAVLDQVVMLPNRLQFLGEMNGVNAAWRTALYPYTQFAAVRGVGRPTAGAYTPSVLVNALVDVPVRGIGQPTGGLYQSSSVVFNLAESQAKGAALPAAGTYQPAITIKNLSETQAKGAALPAAGSNILAVIRSTQPTDLVKGGAKPAAGSYSL